MNVGDKFKYINKQSITNHAIYTIVSINYQKLIFMVVQQGFVTSIIWPEPVDVVDNDTTHYQWILQSLPIHKAQRGQLVPPQHLAAVPLYPSLSVPPMRNLPGRFSGAAPLVATQVQAQQPKLKQPFVASVGDVYNYASHDGKVVYNRTIEQVYSNGNFLFSSIEFSSNQLSLNYLDRLEDDQRFRGWVSGTYFASKSNLEQPRASNSNPQVACCAHEIEPRVFNTFTYNFCIKCRTEV